MNPLRKKCNPEFDMIFSRVPHNFTLHFIRLLVGWLVCLSVCLSVANIFFFFMFLFFDPAVPA